MRNTTRAERRRRRAVGLVMAASLVAAACQPTLAADGGPSTKANMNSPVSTPVSPASLTARQRSIAPIGAATAVGDLPRLSTALERGLDAGLSIGEAREVLVQMYAYAGFPRSLNALGELMKLLESRRARGIHDAPGREPGPVPSGAELLALGTANQTRLSGAPVRGPLFDFAPTIDTYLKTHLFGDIFARDNLDWPSRELATIGALAALSGVDSQLQSHIKIGMNVGLTAGQLRELADGLADAGQTDAAQRMHTTLDRTLADTKPR